MSNATNVKKNINKTKSTNQKKKKKKNPVLRFIRNFFITIFCILVLCAVACTGVILAVIKTAPSLDINGTILSFDQPSALYDSQGQQMDTVITTQKRTVVKLASLPKNLTNAVISIEDEHFYEHGGIDIKRIASAAFIDLLNKIHKQGNIQGASTITQELIKQRMFLNDSLQNRLDFKRKIQEAYLAEQLETYLNKDQILEAYLNTIYLGGQANGVEAAANQYFNKSAKDLNLIECAFIAGLPQSPSRYYPFSTYAKKNPSIYINRTKTVLSKMLENNKISSEEYSNAIKDLNSNKLVFSAGTNSDKYKYPWFSGYTVEQVKNDLKAQYNYTDEQVSNLINNGGLKIYTTMDRSLEEAAQKIINDDKSYGINSWKDKSGIIEPQASATLVDYKTGQVKVIIGGRGDQPPGSYNRATTTVDVKQVGSSIKPLTVYSPAIENKVITAATIVQDTPVDDTFKAKYQNYDPHNDDFSNNGPTTIRDAITRSVNVVAAKVEDMLGLDNGAAYAEKYGIKLDNQDKSSIAALSLGALTYGTNSLTMAAAYGTFGNSGLYVTPRAYTKVVDNSGATILESSYSTRKVISAQTAYIMYDLLKGPIHSAGGTAANTSADLGAMPSAGKTGTTTDSKNLWFCGLTPYYSAAVWMGDDEKNPESLSRIAGSSTCAEVWGLIMKEATKNLAAKDIARPSGISDVTICKSSGKLPVQGCYNAGTTYSEMFIDGTAPTDSCTVHAEQNPAQTAPNANSGENSTTTTTTTTGTTNTTQTTNTTGTQGADTKNATNNSSGGGNNLVTNTANSVKNAINSVNNAINQIAH